MANIAINNYCNLDCKYCFASEMRDEKSTSISLDNFRAILNWLSRSPKNFVGIIGGEPTIHPKFKEILHEVNTYCRDVDTEGVLFTNGIELEKFLPDIGDRIGILLNVNTPCSMSTDKWNKLISCLDHLDLLCWFDRRVTVGCNIYMDCDDYSFIWEIVRKYKLKHIRTSITAPNPKLNLGKEEYYTIMKPKLIEFCKKAIENDCGLGLDCNHIPSCYFTDEEKEIVYAAYNRDGGREYDSPFFCEPVVDITPDFRASACFGSYDPVDMRDFSDIDSLMRYLIFKKSYPRYVNNCTGKCTNCKKYELMECQGGCLGFGSCAH